jgi:vitamin B12/bleomycin/antimicrobial peptide transport system ATP-binding/permease protein
MLSFLHILLSAPRFVFLDRPGTVLSPEQIDKIVKMLSDCAISYINSSMGAYTVDLYDAILEIHKDGSWDWQTLKHHDEGRRP